MDLAWITDLPERQTSRESNVMGKTRFWGPIRLGYFRYLDDEGGGFWFLHVAGTRFSIYREW